MIPWKKGDTYLESYIYFHNLLLKFFLESEHTTQTWSMDNEVISLTQTYIK